VASASAFGGGGMAVAMTFGLLSRFGGPLSAVVTMLVSLVIQVLGTWVWPVPAPMAMSCAVSLVVYVAVAIGERRRARNEGAGARIPAGDAA
jgi:hypothetical protein